MALWKVMYEDWQMECCGEPFAVGDEVAWPLRVDGDRRDDAAWAADRSEIEGPVVRLDALEGDWAEDDGGFGGGDGFEGDGGFGGGDGFEGDGGFGGGGCFGGPGSQDSDREDADGGDDGGEDAVSRGADGGDDGGEDAVSRGADGGDDGGEDAVSRGADGGDDGGEDAVSRGADGGDDGGEDAVSRGADGGDDGGEDAVSRGADGGDDGGEDAVSRGADGGDDGGEDAVSQGADGEGVDGEGVDGEGADGEGADGEGADGEGADGEGAVSQGAGAEGADGEGGFEELWEPAVVQAHGITVPWNRPAPSPPEPVRLTGLLTVERHGGRWPDTVGRVRAIHIVTQGFAETAEGSRTYQPVPGERWLRPVESCPKWFQAEERSRTTQGPGYRREETGVLVELEVRDA
ncbi:DUF6578 domain-containing protein [Streptomyces sp. KN37]|uniref:DUF6578 domain-containing protein n=1 Tax=Streptomyces sp. KN37 TaxID=3090667 RepID=UPI002A75165A|nr:DUF6578 domain-containing protein [Streptomyces sp. KN37]WPO74174.1 DUF6578 domain-containing protein [Streptomyces sp. KN37]